ncbi:MAG: hypothetical protein AB8G15_02395 [Saprospiraceae bacterium]
MINKGYVWSSIGNRAAITIKSLGGSIKEDFSGGVLVILEDDTGEVVIISSVSFYAKNLSNSQREVVFQVKNSVGTVTSNIVDFN